MKRFFATAVACVLTLSLVGCGVNNANSSGIDTDSKTFTQSEQSSESRENPGATQTISYDSYDSLDDLPTNSEEDFYITETSEGNIQINGYDGASKVVVIPTTIGGKPVVELGDSALANSKVEAVVIPGSVKRIGEYAFQNCMNLRYVKMHEGLISIGCAAFFGCTSLEKADIPEGVECFEDYLFVGTPALKQISIPASVTEMPGGMSVQCPDMVVVTPAGSVAEAVAKEEGLNVVNP